MFSFILFRKTHQYNSAYQNFTDDTRSVNQVQKMKHCEHIHESFHQEQIIIHGQKLPQFLVSEIRITFTFKLTAKLAKILEVSNLFSDAATYILKKFFLLTATMITNLILIVDQNLQSFDMINAVYQKFLTLISYMQPNNSYFPNVIGSHRKDL